MAPLPRGRGGPAQGQEATITSFSSSPAFGLGFMVEPGRCRGPWECASMAQWDTLKPQTGLGCFLGHPPSMEGTSPEWAEPGKVLGEGAPSGPGGILEDVPCRIFFPKSRPVFPGKAGFWSLPATGARWSLMPKRRCPRLGAAARCRGQEGQDLFPSRWPLSPTERAPSWLGLTLVRLRLCGGCLGT